MDKASIRLKCIELCNRHDQKAEDIISKAEILANWVSKDETKLEPKSEVVPIKKAQNKKVDNADIF